MSAPSGREYRVIHYAAGHRVLLRVVRLAWSWDWRYGRDPLFECREALARKQNLADRAKQVAQEINFDIAFQQETRGRRVRVLGSEDAVNEAAQHAIWKDLINVQLTMAMLSALAVKQSLEELGRKHPS